MTSCNLKNTCDEKKAADCHKVKLNNVSLSALIGFALSDRYLKASGLNYMHSKQVGFKVAPFTQFLNHI